MPSDPTTPRSARANSRRHILSATPAAPPAAGIEEGQVHLRTIDGADGGAVAVVFLAMPCIRDHQACMIEQRLRGIAERSGGRLAVSMSEVEDITSAGINAMIVVHTLCRSLGGHLALFGLTRELRRLFKLTHLDRAIVLADDAQVAIHSFDTGHRRRWSLRGRSAGRDAA
jgi:anti-anti-sigma factor